MRQSKINALSIESLIEEIGYSHINNMQVLQIVNDIYGFQARCLRKHVEINDVNVIEVLKSNASFVNKERLVFVLAFNLSSELNKLIKIEGYAYDVIKLKNSYEKCVQLLRDTDVEIPIINPENKNMKYIYVDDFYNAKGILEGNLFQKAKHTKNEKLIKKMDEENFFVNLELIGNILEKFDDYIFYDRENGSVFRYLNAYNLSIYNSDRNVLIDDEKSNKFIADELEKIIRKFGYRMNMDKFLLASAYQISEKLDQGISSEEIPKANQMLKFIKSNIKNNKLKIVRTNNKGDEVTYTVKTIDEYLSRMLSDHIYI